MNSLQEGKEILNGWKEVMRKVNNFKVVYYSFKKINKMENLKEYTGLELIQLLEYLERNRFPSAKLCEKGEAVVEAAAEKLDLEQKEICWIVERPYNEKRSKEEEVKDDKQRREEEAEKRWGQMRWEIGGVREIIVSIQAEMRELKARVKELEKSWTSLSFQNIVKKE